jgi:hypothetical protein
MPILSADEFWDLLTGSGLVEPAIVSALRQAFATRPGATVADSRAIAAWLAETGVLTLWQARRVGNGDRGPFVIGDYRLLERHDFPGTALLFSARHVPSGNVVQLVRLDPRACAQPDSWATLVRRMSVANRLADPALSRTWALDQVGNHRLVVCEHIAGTSLADELASRGPLPLAEAGATALRIASAVAEIHAAGEVHGSLSLDTVIRPRGDQPAGAVGAGPAVRLLQFPLADDPHRFPVRPPLDTAEQIDRLGRRAGFVAPELALPGAVCDQRSDVYALGCILHALVSGRQPGREGDPRASLRDAATIGLPPLGPAVPAEIGTLVSYLAARDPAGRYPTAIEAANAIATCFGLQWSPPTEVVAPAALPANGPVVAVDVPRQPVPAKQAGPTAVKRPAVKRPAVKRPAVKRPAVTRTAQVQTAQVQTAQAQSPEAWFWKLMAWMFGLFFAAIVGLTVAWFVRSGRNAPAPAAPPRVTPPVERQPVAPQPPVSEPPASEPRPVDEPPAEPAVETPRPAQASPLVASVVVSDALDLPWVSPTTGPPPALEYLSPGAQLVLLARPADLLADAEGNRLLRAFGPAVEAMLQNLTGICGCDVADIDQVQAAWQGDPAGGVVATLVIRLATGRQVSDTDAFTSRAWNASGTKQIAGVTIHPGRFLGQDAAFWLPEREAGRVLVVASPAIVESIVAAWAEGFAEPAALPQPLETLLGMLDGTRHVTLFGMPHFVFTSGRSLLVGPLGALADPLAAFLGDDVQAAAISLHAADHTYVEFDAVAPRDIPPARVAKRLLADLERLPATVEDYCVGVDARAYGRRLIQRLPQMLQILVANLRGTGEGRGAVLNARLPRQAGHNIVLATELALAQPPGGATIVAAAAPPAAAARDDARTKLRRIITLSFPKDTLEKSIQMLSDEIGVPMEILGGDLQLEGITKNQSFGLDEVERPAEAVLLAILAKANPDGKLIYVIRNRDGVESIEITTRAAAEKRGDPVPAGSLPAVGGPS